MAFGLQKDQCRLLQEEVGYRINHHHREAAGFGVVVDRKLKNKRKIRENWGDLEGTGVLRLLGLLVAAENVGKHWGLKKLGNF